jgi:hypothetical protein
LFRKDRNTAAVVGKADGIDKERIRMNNTRVYEDITAEIE